MAGMKFTVSVPQEILDGMDEQAHAAEITRSELVRRAILAYGTPSASPSENVLDCASVIAERNQLSALVADRDQELTALREEYQHDAAEIERLRERVTEMARESGRHAAEAERLRADLDVAERTIARADNEIAWLRALTERLARPNHGE